MLLEPNKYDLNSLTYYKRKQKMEGFILQTTQAYDMDYDEVAAIKRTTANLTEFYQRLEEFIENRRNL